MRNASTQNATAGPSLQRQTWKSEDEVRWAVGIATALASIALVLAAIASAPASIRSNNNRCLEQVANDEHISLEAFFQNPAQQGALVQAITICSR